MAIPVATTELVDRDEILPLMGPVVKQGEWLMGYCPVHNDGAKHGTKGGQSLGLSAKGVLQCFAGCSFKDVIATLRGPNYRPAEQVPAFLRNGGQGEAERLVNVYSYTDEDGVVVAEKARFERADGRKTFRWRMPDAEGWTGLDGLTMADMPLYNVAALSADVQSAVYFVEGEKACDSCKSQGLLAVTHGGGASIKDFGKSLDVLRGRTVYLWPDNDAPGAAYMALVKAKLTLMSCTVRLVSVVVPPKGDAYDYFATGGTVEAIEKADPERPLVQLLADNCVKVVISTVAGPVTFLFGEMEKKRREFVCELTITCFNDSDPYVEQLNLNSASGTTNLRRDLDTVYGKEFGWTRVLNKVFGLAREAYLAQERGVDVFDLPEYIGEVLLVPPLVVADGPTILFGDGASLKSYITSRLALSMALGVEYMGMRTPMLVPMVVDYEDSGANFKRRLKRLALGIDASLTEVMGVHYWDAKGVPLSDQVDGLKRYIEKHGIGLLIIDSVAPACGGDPLDHGAVLDFFGALKRLGLPSILIAHVTKAMESTKPFGSAYWHNLARRTWYVQRAAEEDSDEVDVGLFNRKVNDGRVPAPLAFHVSFSENERGPVRLSLASMERAPAALRELGTPRSQVWAALEGLPRTIKDIGQETNLPERTVENVLKAGPFVQAGETRPGMKGGRPSLLWARQSSFRQGFENPHENRVNQPEEVYAR